MSAAKTASEWPSVALPECCEIVSGATPRRDVPNYWGGNIAWATPRDLSNLEGCVLEDTPEKISEEGYKSCSATLMPKGSVLFSSRAPIGLVAIAGREMCTNQGFKSLVPSAGVDSSYLYWCMKHMAPQIAEMGNGATFKEVSKAVMDRVQIPLPPLPEQQRIAAILDKADAIRRKRQETIALTGELLRSTFLEMFGDPVTNPKGWPTKTIGEIAPESGQIVDGPFGSTLKPDCYVSDGVRVIRNFNIHEGWFDDSDFRYVTHEKFAEIRRSEVQPGDLLVSTKGTVGDVCGMPSLPGKCVLSATGTVRIRVTSSEWERDFIVRQMIVPSYRAYIQRRQAGSIQKYLNLSGIREFVLIKPPVELQKSFVEFVERNRQLRDRLKLHQRESNELFNSLVQRAFRGEL